MRSSSLHIDFTTSGGTRAAPLAGEIARSVAQYACDRDSQIPGHLELVVTEAVSNVIVHAHGGDSMRPVRVEIDLQQGVITILVHDSGPGFSMAATPDPGDPYAENGRGIFLMRKLMDVVEYHRRADGNVLQMVKHLTPTE